MKRIKNIVDRINDEIESAKYYAEEYIMYKADGDSANAARFEEMARDEVEHANLLHDTAAGLIARLRKVAEPTAEMLDIWNATHNKYIDCVNWIKTMLSF